MEVVSSLRIGFSQSQGSYGVPAGADPLQCWLTLRLACDASPYGVEAVLSHVMPDGEEKPILYASRMLSKLHLDWEGGVSNCSFEYTNFISASLVTSSHYLLTIGRWPQFCTSKKKVYFHQRKLPGCTVHVTSLSTWLHHWVLMGEGK